MDSDAFDLNKEPEGGFKYDGDGIGGGWTDYLRDILVRLLEEEPAKVCHYVRAKVLAAETRLEKSVDSRDAGGGGTRFGESAKARKPVACPGCELALFILPEVSRLLERERESARARQSRRELLMWTFFVAVNVVLLIGSFRSSPSQGADSA